LLARLGVGAALDPPVAEPLGSPGVRVAEHVQRLRVPVVHRVLDPLFLLAALGYQVSGCRRAEIDMALFLRQHRTNSTVERLIAAADELVELELSDAVHEEAKDGEVFPCPDVRAERLDVALLVIP